MRINLLPEAERPLKQNAIRWEFLVIFFGLVLFITINTYAYLQTLTIQMQQQEYDNLVSYGNMLQHQYQKVSALQNENQELSDKIAQYERIVRSPDVDTAPEDLQQIVNAAPERVWLEFLELGETGIAIAGYTTDSSLVSLYLQRLRKNGFDAAVNSLNQSDIGASLFRFTITSQRGE